MMVGIGGNGAVRGDKSGGGFLDLYIGRILFLLSI